MLRKIANAGRQIELFKEKLSDKTAAAQARNQ